MYVLPVLRHKPRHGLSTASQFHFVQSQSLGESVEEIFLGHKFCDYLSSEIASSGNIFSNQERKSWKARSSKSVD